jgi:lysyl-tRNA synthetase class I
MCKEGFTKKTNAQKYCSTPCAKKANHAQKLSWQRNNGRKNRAIIDQIKVEAGCCKCGYNAHPAALDFNHKNPLEKSFSIGARSTGLTIEQLKEEISKCEILCANCHRVHTYTEQHYDVRRPT